MKKNRKALYVFLIISIFLQTLFLPVFAFDQAYFNKLSDKDKGTINLINSINPAVVSITWREEMSQNTVRCYIIFNGICITSWDQQSSTQSWFVDVVKWSWFFVASNWYIVTNRHVVEQTDLTYEVMTLDGKKYPVEILSRNDSDDMALLKIKGTDFSYLKLFNSDNIMIWQSVYAIGNTLWEYQNTVTEGIISWLDRTITAWFQNGTWEEVLSWAIQTSASISSWNSWWPLIDSIWNLIGINTAMDLGWQNIWFAIPSNKIIDFIKRYRNTLKK